MPTNNATVCHLSFHVSDLGVSRRFYIDLLGCGEGRSAPTWVDIDFFGHQVSLHEGTPITPAYTGDVDGVAVPMPHFGAVLPLKTWQQVAARLEAANIEFVIAPHVRYEGQSGEQHTMFFLDPSGNAIELKSMNRQDELFHS